MIVGLVVVVLVCLFVGVKAGDYEKKEGFNETDINVQSNIQPRRAKEVKTFLWITN